jgi:Uma2 family endonuclease
MTTVYDDVAFGPRNYKLAEEEVEKRVIQALDMVGILHLKDRAPFKLSGGEKRAAAIASVLSMQPDILVACDVEGNVNAKGKYMGTPKLVVEILSDSTRSKDMIDKLNTYRLSGVKEYWVIDPKQEKIMIYEFDDCEIDRFQVYDKEDIAQSIVFAGLSADTKELFNVMR